MPKKSYLKKRKYNKKPSSGIISKNKKKAVAKKLRLFSFALISVLMAFTVMSGVLAYKFIKAPFTKASYVDYNDNTVIWDDEQTTILFCILDDINNEYSEIKELAIVNFDNESHDYNIFILPVDYNLEYALNYGSGPLKRIYAVGNTDDGRGAYLLQKTILKLLAIDTDGYIFIDDKATLEFKTNIDEVNLNDISALFRLKNIYKIPDMLSFVREDSITNLKLSDIYKFYSFAKNTSETSSFVTEVKSYQLDEIYKWDQVWKGRHKFTSLKSEGIKVFVANASENNMAGLATWGGRVVENMGLELFSTKNSTKALSENTIITSDLNLKTVSALKNVLEIENIVDVNTIDQSQYNSEISRTEVSLYLSNF